MTTRKVLIPMDGSELSRHILDHVQRLLAPSECELLLLRVAEPPEGRTAFPPRPVSLTWTEPLYDSREDIELAQHPLYASQSWQNIRSAIEAEMLDQVHTLKDAGYTVKVLVRFGDPAREIVDAAAREHADLVAMATHGRTGLGRMLLGSVTEQVLRSLETPLLIIRPFERSRNGHNA